ncbi:TonB-dependent siderophore receptor [Sphingomonas sp. LY29]|uniref:TonB-dependent receptor n=1 Tax=Sphingomonas sp. LY29 TaxID=3095341 RepID=UPI002D76D0BF|nr:TonB-dependent siderophore receptor [Sphingomonas sp. LY29]WRP25236.1 TonB-dependent siderophore receptor [Sphingomonas sp. LY29]
MHAGITSTRKAVLAFAGSTLLIGSGAQAADVVDNAPDADEAKAQSVTVTGERYRINTLNSRLGDVRDAPQSISIIPRAVIEQQSATNLRDVLRNVTGISFAAGEGGGGPGGDNLTLRGFAARNDIFVDGIRDFASYTRDTFNVEQVEVVKGPASAQTGRGSTGGYINLFTKQPQARSFVGGTLGLGTLGYYRGTADLNLAGSDLGVGGGTAARVNLLFHDVKTPGRDHVDTKRYGIAPSIAFGLGGSTRAIVTAMHLRQNNVPDYGIPFVPATHTGLVEFRDRPAPVDYDNYYGLLDRDREKLRTNILTFAVEHDLSPGMRIANTTRYGHATRDSIYSAPRFDGNTTQIVPQTQSRDTLDKSLVNQTNLFAKFATGSMRHDLIAGIEIARETSRNQPRTITAGTSTDLFDPDPNRPWIGTIVDTPGGPIRASADTLAAYLFDTVHFSEKLLLSGGLRWERFKSAFDAVAPSPELGRTDETLTWRAGLTYKPISNLGFYIGAGTSVNPSIENMTQTTPTAAVVALKPERSRTIEVGAKWDGLGGKLLLNGALFRIEKTNARTPGQLGEAPTVLEGEQRVDGIELGATGWLAKRWQLIAAYTYLDSEVIKSNTATEIGNRLQNVPTHSATLWSNYELPFGVEIGGGARYVGHRYTNVANVRRVDDYWLFDATAAYNFDKQTSLRVNLFNLTDERYIDQVGGGHFVPGAGRSAVATLAFRL